MNVDEFFSRLKAVAQPPEDVDGKPIEELAGLLIRPLDAEDTLAVGEYAEKHGRENAYQMILARAIRLPDGTRQVDDEHAPNFKGCINGPLARAVRKIRKLSGLPWGGPGEDEEEAGQKAEAEKKTGLTKTSE